MSSYVPLLWTATLETLYMVLVSTIFSYILGLPIGILSYMTEKDGLSPNRPVNTITGWIINLARSIPFIILLVALIPFTRLLVGKSIGSTAAIVPLVIAAAPFVARMVESSFNEVDPGVILSAQAMGASHFQIIMKVLLPETLPSLIRGVAIATITIVGYTAMAGAVGGGGLGDVAIRYGYHRYEYGVMIATIVILVVLVQLIQVGFSLLAKRMDKNI